MSCPELATPVINVTRDTMNSLLLSTYTRLVGTEVQIGCLMPEAYVLKGEEYLKCLANSTWDKPRPYCEIDNGFLDENRNPTTTAAPAIAASTSDLSTRDIAAIVVGGVSAVILVIAMILMCLAWRSRRKDMERKHVHTRSNEDEHFNGNPRHHPPHPLDNPNYWRPDFMRLDYNGKAMSPYMLPKASLHYPSLA